MKRSIFVLAGVLALVATGCTNKAVTKADQAAPTATADGKAPCCETGKDAACCAEGKEGACCDEKK